MFPRLEVVDVCPTYRSRLLSLEHFGLLYSALRSLQSFGARGRNGGRCETCSLGLLRFSHCSRGFGWGTYGLTTEGQLHLCSQILAMTDPLIYIRSTHTPLSSTFYQPQITTIPFRVSPKSITGSHDFGEKGVRFWAIWFLHFAAWERLRTRRLRDYPERTKQCATCAHHVLSYTIQPTTRRLSRSPLRRAPCSTLLECASVPSR